MKKKILSYVMNGLKKPVFIRLKNISLGLIVISSLSLATCKPRQVATQTEPTDVTTDVPFKKEGNLSFVDGKSNKVISKLDIEVAQTPDETQQGLMYRRSMLDTCGMIFIFNDEEDQSFWMKNTYIPLDIIYVSAKKEIVSIAADCRPLSEESIPSKGKAKYVVEVNGGYAAKQGLKPGDKIDFTVDKK
jgi:uncharacterized membrane protein (UPF0127 family)